MAKVFGIRGTRLDIHWGKVDLFTASPAGMVTRFTTEVTREASVVAEVITAAGTRKYGRGLLAKDYSVKKGKMGPSSCTVLLSNSRPYAAYVFRGTQTPIRAKGKKRMPVGKSQLGLPPGSRAPNAARFTHRRKVRGQSAKNYPMRAIAETFMRRGM